MPFTIVRHDITKLKVDAIVNAANTSLKMGGGVCGAIFAAAGADRLQAACDAYASINTGEAVITKGFDLPAKYIIHTAGPVYRDGKQGEEALLRACYTNSLELALKHNCESIAFPLISSGIYGYPKAEALRVATSAIRDFLAEHDMDVSLVVFDKDSFAISEQLLGAVESYIDEHYVDERDVKRSQVFDAVRDAQSFNEVFEADVLKLKKEKPKFERTRIAPKPDMPTFAMPTVKAPPPMAPMTEDAKIGAPIPGKARIDAEIAGALVQASLDDVVGKLDEPFSVTLMRLIDSTGKKDAEVYHRANIDRRLFSKIRGNEQYTPSKPTVLAFAIALELTLAQTEDLLERAGFALSNSRKFDVIVRYFIENRKYDIFEINEVLFSYDQALLGASFS